MPQGQHRGRHSSLVHQRERQRRQRFIGAGVVILILAVFGLVMLTRGEDDRPSGVAEGAAGWDATPFAGGPRLAVDQAVVDHGEVEYEHTVEAVFRLRNVGDQPLQIETPEVEIVEGC